MWRIDCCEVLPVACGGGEGGLTIGFAHGMFCYPPRFPFVFYATVWPLEGKDSMKTREETTTRRRSELSSVAKCHKTTQHTPLGATLTKSGDCESQSLWISSGSRLDSVVADVPDCIDDVGTSSVMVLLFLWSRQVLLLHWFKQSYQVLFDTPYQYQTILVGLGSYE